MSICLNAYFTLMFGVIAPIKNTLQYIFFVHFYNTTIDLSHTCCNRRLFLIFSAADDSIVFLFPLYYHAIEKHSTYNIKLFDRVVPEVIYFGIT